MTFDWKVMGVCEDKVHLQAEQISSETWQGPRHAAEGQQNLHGTSDGSIKNYFRLDHDVVRSPLAYIMRITIVIQKFGDHLMNVTPNDKMIFRVLNLLPDMNKLLREHEASLFIDHMTEFEIDNKAV